MHSPTNTGDHSGSERSAGSKGAGSIPASGPSTSDGKFARKRATRPKGLQKKNLRLTALILASGVLPVVAYGVLVPTTAKKHASISARVPPAEEGIGAINLPPPDLLRPLTPQEALKENTERPFVNRPDTPAAKFVLQAPPEDRDRALNCLAQAIYYEAAGEGTDGQRAVAQVVLNRVRHPGFPASICGVVYQGSERNTGCQFTFTCNGSLLHAPQPDLWARSRKIAQEALSGKVFGPIGHATHYHAEYVLPYWADALDKTVQIGRHIFYRLRSTLGDRIAFSQRYGGTEPVLGPPYGALVLPPSAATEQLAGALLSNNVNGPPFDVEKAAPPATSPLAADANRGSLIADGSAPTAATPRAKAKSDCTASTDSKQLSPMGKADLRAGSLSSGC